MWCGSVHTQVASVASWCYDLCIIHTYMYVCMFIQYKLYRPIRTWRSHRIYTCTVGCAGCSFPTSACIVKCVQPCDLRCFLTGSMALTVYVIGLNVYTQSLAHLYVHCVYTQNLLLSCLPIRNIWSGMTSTTTT